MIMASGFEFEFEFDAIIENWSSECDQRKGSVH